MSERVWFSWLDRLTFGVCVAEQLSLGFVVLITKSFYYTSSSVNGRRWWRWRHLAINCCWTLPSSLLLLLLLLLMMMMIMSDVIVPCIGDRVSSSCSSSSSSGHKYTVTSVSRHDVTENVGRAWLTPKTHNIQTNFWLLWSPALASDTSALVPNCSDTSALKFSAEVSWCRSVPRAFAGIPSWYLT